MSESPFSQTLASEADLRRLIGEPSELVKRKQLDALDPHCRAFIALSPFLALGTSDARGNCDVSPRGDAPGFVRVLDAKRLLIPERPGNRRIDSLSNILSTGRVGLLFVIPGVDEELRVNGRAWVTVDDAPLGTLEAQGKKPLAAIGVEVQECFLHCGKAIKRSKLWDPASRVVRDALPSLGRMLCDQVRPEGVTVEQLEAQIQESYEKRLY